jgi:hypothetical protein
MDDRTMDELPPMPDLGLTMEQDLRLERSRRELPGTSRAELEEMTVEFVKMTLILQNNLSQVFKWAVSGKTEQAD